MPKKNTKQFIADLPVVGYLARLTYNIARLPKIHDEFAISNQRMADQQRTQSELVQTQLAEISRKISALQERQDALRQQLSILETSTSAQKSNNGSRDKELFADDHVLDKFYTEFEDRFRGSETMISERQKEYLPYFINSKLDFKKTPVLDIGSGRGEFLQLLKKNKIRAIGLDINHDMVERSVDKGLEAVEGDALDHLQKTKAQSYGSITGFHIVEHIPFPLLMRIFENAHRALVENGFVIFETPNPENVVVGSDTFHMDPSHLSPIPPALLSFALETCGFRNIEIKRIHPDEQGEEAGKLPEAVKNRLFGPRDYAVIAYR